MEKSLGARLLAVAEMIPPCTTLVDCGCDHGYVSIYAAENKIAERICASDINRGPLDNAEREIAAAGYGDKIKTVLTDGLDGLPYHDCVVIAGMGGELISDIISRAPWTKEGSTLILQPMTRAETLREYLYREGFEIFCERFVAEGGHLYCIISARFAGSSAFEPFEKYISRKGLSAPCADIYADKIIARLKYEYEKKKTAGALSEEECARAEADIKSLCEARGRI